VTVGAIALTNGVILIDAPLRTEDVRSWLAIVHNKFRANANRVLVNLDAHPDRTLGARSMDCTIIAHQKTAQVFRSRPSVFKGQNAESGSEWETFDDVVGTRWAVPDITFISRIYLNWGAMEVILEHHPGPAPGSIWVLIPEAGVIFIGDTVLASQPPFLTYADIPTWIDSLNVLLSDFPGLKLIGGRDGVLTDDHVRAQRQQLKNILKGLERLARRNASPEAVEGLIPALLSDLEFPVELAEQYTMRYRHGLYQYYTRNYRPTEALNE
jgi:glyoxylase-like metal-dependent hydrolase (beta-lactamase superfamily II)